MIPKRLFPAARKMYWGSRRDRGPGCFGSPVGAREISDPDSQTDFASKSQLEGEVGEGTGVTIMVTSDASTGYVKFETQRYDLNSGYKPKSKE